MRLYPESVTNKIKDSRSKGAICFASFAIFLAVPAQWIKRYSLLLTSNAADLQEDGTKGNGVPALKAQAVQ